MKTFVYVDAFNLYYGALKGTPYRWLDIRRMCELMLPKNQLERICIFTARVNARPLRPGVLAASQFANPLQDAAGTFFKPSSW